MSFVEIDNVSKSFKGQSAPVVDDVSLSINEGEILALLGKSGCGKTTLLKMIAGLEEQDAGTIAIDGAVVDDVPAEKRPVSMVFQKALLFRNMTVAQNIGFALRVNKTEPKNKIAEGVEEMLRLIDMEGLGSKRATELSGGQEQRVSLARALMTKPKVLLLDEPLSALDAQLRSSLRREIRRLNKTLGTTMIFVTHDQEEAVEVADRIALMDEGKIAQCDSPEAFYQRPVSMQVARFFGWQNFIPAKRVGNKAVCALGEFECYINDDVASDGILAIRPEAAQNVENGAIAGRLVSSQLKGAFSYCKVDCDGHELVLSLRDSSIPPTDCPISFDLDPKLMALVPSDQGHQQ